MSYRKDVKVALFSAAAAGLVLMSAAQTANVVLPQDKGSDKLDVSKFPPEIQAGYKVFAEKCAKCHTLARPLNTAMTKEDWNRYVKRMMHKPNSGINDKQGKQIFDFLVYDQENRKDKNPKAFFQALSDEELQKLGAGK